MVAESREHRVPVRVLVAVAQRESQFAWWAVGDHGAALGVGQLHASAVPGYPLSRFERLDPRSGVHWMAVRLALSRRRCHGRANWESEYSGRRCGSPVYFTEVVSR